MPIELIWQDERGETLAHYEGPIIDQRITSLFPAYGPCLRFIDPIGDTIFNQAQISALAGELDAMLEAGQKRKPPEALFALRQFVRNAIGHVHTYLRFIGD